MRAIEKAKAHYVTQLEKPKSYYVEDWDLTVYVYPINLAELDRLSTLEGTNINQALDIMLMIARDENNDPLFTDEDRDSLLKEVDPKVILHIANELAVDLTPKEDSTKNALKKVAN